jgi:quercetin dioxygenase-like cupin family protein
MAKLTVIAKADVLAHDQYQAPRVVTKTLSSSNVGPDGYSLWVCDSQLADGATIEWDADHGDDAVYVLSGELDVTGRRCPPGGAMIVESGAAVMATAIGETRVVHFGCTDPTPPADGLFGPAKAEGHGVHIVGPNGMFQSGQREGVRAIWYADSTCDTCRAQLLEVVSPPTRETRGKAHSHSMDEIIYLLEGTIKMGAYHLEPFTALCVPGGARYALVGGPDGHRFLNFRRDVSEQIYERESAPLLETGLSRGGQPANDVR